MLRVSAKVDYAVRALVRIAEGAGQPVKMHVIARETTIPKGFLGGTLTELRRAGLIESRRGGDGGYWLARPSGSITVAEIIEVLDGELLDVRALIDASAVTAPAWTALRDAVEATLGHITIHDLAGAHPPGR